MPQTLPKITFVLTSCGRHDLLEITLDSFLRYNTCKIHEFIIVEDGPFDHNSRLVEKYREFRFRWLATGVRIGQVGAIDLAYRNVTGDYIFHCEDDWEFTAPGFVEKSVSILQSSDYILQVYLRAVNDTHGHPVSDKLFMAEGVPYRLLRHHYDAGKWGIWHGLSWNPGLRRVRDYHLIGSFGTLDPAGDKLPWEVEKDASALYQQHGFYAAILADNGGKATYGILVRSGMLSTNRRALGARCHATWSSVTTTSRE